MLPKMSIHHICIKVKHKLSSKFRPAEETITFKVDGKMSSGRALGQMSFSTAFLDHLEECPEMVHVWQCSVVSDGLPH